MHQNYPWFISAELSALMAAWQQAEAGHCSEWGRDLESGTARLCRSCHGKLFAGPALVPVLLEAIMQCWSWIILSRIS